ncbi:MAG: tubulin--tyrosine ligase family protein [Proteobacteria bacterium]|nr:tubulin--tyrosine ligase family protein [Pseudomonadota bacterium]
MASNFYFSDKSPTFANLKRHLKKLHFQQSAFIWLSAFNEKHFLFDEKAAEQLEYKHLLAELVKLHCQDVMPLTFCLDDHNWPFMLNQLAKDSSLQNERWILKPSLLNNGEAIRIFSSLVDVESHYIMAKRYAGPHVLQSYIKEPHLLKAHKYSIRMFVILTNYQGAFLYPKGYFNVALKPFKADDFSDLTCHLTNEHLSHTEANVIQIPTEQFDFFPELYPQIKAILTKIITGLKALHPKAFCKVKNPALAIFGFDFLVDNQKRVWLLEANHGPCFPKDEEHILQKHLYDDFWHHFIQSFALTIMKKDYSREPLFFESLK